ncbi:hypothetical protein GQ85_24010 [Rhodococcus rhodochrous]|nr:hypothetical protein GQ85_24010 [Rhodococcus rhodochrous]
MSTPSDVRYEFSDVPKNALAYFFVTSSSAHVGSRPSMSSPYGLPSQNATSVPDFLKNTPASTPSARSRTSVITTGMPAARASASSVRIAATFSSTPA